MFRDCMLVVLWCLAVYVCMSEVEAEGEGDIHTGTGDAGRGRV